MENKDLIYNNKELLGENILRLIKKEGYTKSSFAKRTSISRSTLDKILDGDMPSSITLENYINKIIEILNVNIEALLYDNYTEVQSNTLNTIYYDNVSQDYERSITVKEKFELLDDILDLCEIYYK